MQQSTSKSTVVVITSVGFTLAACILSYILNIYLANHFSPELYGDYSIALRILSLTATLSLLGTNTSIHQFFSRFYREGSIERAIAYLNWNLRFILPAFLVSVGLGITLFVTAFCLHLLGIKMLDDYHLAVYMFWMAPLESLCLLLFAVLVGIGRPKTSTFIRSVFRVALFFVFFFIGIQWFGLEKSTLSIALVIFVVYLSLLVLELFSIGRFIFPICKNLLKKPKLGLTKQWKSLALKLAYSNVIYLIICATDLLIVESIHPHEAAVGHYSAVMLISSLIATLSSVTYITLRPDVSHLLGDSSTHNELRARLLKSNGLCLIVSLMIAIVLCLFGHQVLAMFGQVYVKVYPVLFVSVLSSLAGILALPSTMLLAYSGNEKLLMKINTIEFLLLVALGSLLTFYFSIMGMAIATLIVRSVKSTLFMIGCYRSTGFKAWSLI